MDEDIAIIDLKSEAAVPVWSVTHTVETFSSNYLKIQSLRNICVLFQQGLLSEDFRIAASSFDLYPESDGRQSDDKELVVLQSKGDSAKRFWNLFKRLHRPIVLVRQQDDEFYPIYDIESEEALRIPSLSVESPFRINLQGTLGSLIDLFTGKAVAVRENERISASIENLNNIVKTSHLIEDPQTPVGIRRFAVDQMEAIINKQANVNKRLGIQGDLQLLPRQPNRTQYDE